MATSYEKADALMHDYDNLSSAIRIVDQQLPYRLLFLTVAVVGALVAVSVQRAQPAKVPSVVFVMLMLLFLALILTITYMRVQACIYYRRMSDIELQVNALLRHNVLQTESRFKRVFNKLTQRSPLGVGVWCYLLWYGLSLVGYFASFGELHRLVATGQGIPAWIPVWILVWLVMWPLSLGGAALCGAIVLKCIRLIDRVGNWPESLDVQGAPGRKRKGERDV